MREVKDEVATLMLGELEWKSAAVVPGREYSGLRRRSEENMAHDFVEKYAVYTFVWRRAPSFTVL